MAATSSTLLSLLALRCPRCHRGPLFTHSAFNLTRFTDMPKACPVCRQVYEPEPGFYWGAMYISFVFSTAIMLVTGFLVYHLLDDPAVWVYVTWVAVAAVLLTPLSLRYSRALMLYLFGGTGYDPRYAGSPYHPTTETDDE
ncbi:DUF983 domain-containing protein [Hymenobacter weizhouensis]|uniref:DUF983 domain-containing protein n=1 Tax=Hymenobacter sp. YIM 151500-1 TaxID=2987689 RepID=UPI002225B851|nr:DUF983 domain-containing protein [Hymenobacter sp. YIM 151500-1]UYZ63325.1 DUF983 domain-containing protein [Hymenobacter sp. YIM 151500-1]